MSDTQPTSARRVELTFEHELDELREGLKAPVDRRPLWRRTKTMWALSAWALFVIAAGCLFVIFQQRQSARIAFANITLSFQPPQIDAWTVVMPSVLGTAAMLVFFGGVVWTSLLTRAKSPRVRKLTPIGIMFVLISWVLIIWYAVALPAIPPWGPAWTMERDNAVKLAMVPWLIALATLIVLSIWTVRRSAKRQWNTKPSLRRRQTIVLDETGMTKIDEKVSNEYRWSYFVKAWETPRTIALLDENRLCHVLPKRSMADPSALWITRSLISGNIAECKLAVEPTGFAVAPVPAIPVTETT